MIGAASTSGRLVTLFIAALLTVVTHDAGAEPDERQAARDERATSEAIILRPKHDAATAKLADALQAMLNDTAQDLDLVVELEESPPIAEHALAAAARARGKLIVWSSLRAVDDEVELRLVAAHPDNRVLSVQVARLDRQDLEVRALVMLRDVVRGHPGRSAPDETALREALPSALPSPGRSIFAVNGTLYGGFVGYSLQRASESDDPRLLYPLIAVGAGVGLGATLIVADEWDVGVGDAWFLAGVWWPTVAGHLIYEGRFGDTPTASADEAWSFGLIGSVIGLTVSTTALLPRGMGDGGAVLAHSGGALGLMIGGLAEFARSGDAERIPFAGMGYGAASGWLLASGTAMLWHPAPGRVLLIDLGLLLGGLAGASAASPLLFDEPNADKTRGWAAATGGGLVAGGVLAAILSVPDDPAATAELPAMKLPSIGVLPVKRSLGEVDAPAFGVTWSGEIW